jgi:dolichol-phosphate mannosyltransferase
MDSSNQSTLVIIPTYNELENLPLILGKVQAALPETHILIVDDGSPDGTGALADKRAAEDARIHVLHRTEKNGLGPAYLAGFAWGLDRDYGVIIEMDADGSHPAERLPAMLEALNSPQAPGLVIGSRWVNGGTVVNWPTYRKFISKGGSTYARLMLGLPVRDVTAGFRAFRAEVLRAIDLSGVDSQGYCFQIDLTRRVLAAGYGIVEVPIEFRERELGVSKMSTSIVVEAMLRVTAWGLARPFQALTGSAPSRNAG